ncbi:LysR substrate-binding domain-containing protein [Pantoea vagans]|uniref:LysR substrate-binding domain-containing protein n=1 Tax=Pantoea vagans TaxID=470934 RepID=UPI00076B569D|nr:LysR substrate-binding domain-containing protein [Pantoea vagans]AMG60166.1 LysR family transcriptional regulator [Pantoea vagans]
MDYRQLNAFIVLAEVLHFGRAAFQLNIAQPALSQHIKALETSLGISLFSRDKRHVSLTYEGEKLVKEARVALMHYENFLESAHNLRLGNKGQLKLGFVGTSILDPVLAMLINGYRKHKPGVEIIIEEHNVNNQLQLLQNRRLDIALLRSPIPHYSNLEYLDIATRRLDVVLPCDHPLANEQKISLSSLSESTFLIQHDPPGVGLGWSIMNTCQQAGFVPQKILFTRNVLTAIGQVSIGAGVTLVPETQRALMIQDVKYCQLDDAAAISTLTFSWLRHQKNSVLADFVLYLKTMTKGAVVK